MSVTILSEMSKRCQRDVKEMSKIFTFVTSPKVPPFKKGGLLLILPEV